MVRWAIESTSTPLMSGFEGECSFWSLFEQYVQLLDG
jgi:hypothetical protein